MLGDNWIIKEVNKQQELRLSKALGIRPLTARILISRGYDTAEKSDAFFKNTALKLYDPFLLTDMDKAVTRIKQAIESKEKVCIYGDYDVDGVTATTALYSYLSSKGAVCECFIPERLSEGYGLNNQSIASIAKRNSLIITVDTGITAVEETDFAASLGVDIIITDHHSCRELLPAAVAVVDPHRPDDCYPFKGLAGVGVVFKLICAIEGASELVFEEYADIVAIGTVADVMPIMDENRLIVSRGLAKLSNCKSYGLTALMEQAGVFRDGPCGHISSSTIGYAIAPRINAAGRISSARRALDLFLAQSRVEAMAIAEELCEINKKRQLTEQMIYTEATQQIATSPKDAYSYILASDNWHQGVVGVVASKISEKYSSPAILFSFDGDIGKGSGRSIKGLSLMDALSACSDLLIEYGGHELAAGLSLERKNLPAFRERFEKFARSRLEGKSTVIPVEIDCELGFDEINLQNAEEMTKLEPFGLSNSIPFFILRNVSITDITSMCEDKHIRIRVSKNSSVKETNCVYFGMSHLEFPFCRGDMCDIACTLGVNQYNGNRQPQIIARAVRPTLSEREAIAASRCFYSQIYENKISKPLPPETLPTVEHFRAVFRLLKRELGTERHRVSARYIRRKLWQTERMDINLCALKAIFDVLSEFGLAECIKVRGNDIIEIKLLPYSGKIDLEKSEILKNIKSHLQ